MLEVCRIEMENCTVTYGIAPGEEMPFIIRYTGETKSMEFLSDAEAWARDMYDLFSKFHRRAG